MVAVGAWNATATTYAQERCIHQLFEDQVRKVQRRRGRARGSHAELWRTECGGQPAGPSPTELGVLPVTMSSLFWNVSTT